LRDGGRHYEWKAKNEPKPRQKDAQTDGRRSSSGEQLEALLTPAITVQENSSSQLGLRDRILNLPLMVAAVLTLLWPDVAGVTELTKMLAREGFCGIDLVGVSQ
jgi:hypothetical protein